MRSRVAASVAGVIAMAALVFASAASAATEFGDPCIANGTEDPIAYFEVSAPGNPLPTAAPVSGVLTKWKVNLVPAAPPGIPNTLRVLRLGAGNTALIVGESSGLVNPGANTFNARIPIQAGDRLGLSSNSVIGSLICEAAGLEAHIGAILAGAPGMTVPYEEGEAEFGVPVSAVIEPDVDGDGYGDETQDLCPQSAAFQTACPFVTLDAFSLVGGSSVSVLVATGSNAPVGVTGTVKLGKAGKAKLSAKTKTVTAGKITSFTLKFPQKLKDALKELDPGQKLKLKIVASATNVAGQISTDKLTAKLKG